MKTKFSNLIAIPLSFFIVFGIFMGVDAYIDRDRTEQDVKINYKGQIELRTFIHYNGNIVESYRDVYNDTIKCYRYNQGMELINRLEEIDNIKCN